MPKNLDLANIGYFLEFAYRALGEHLNVEVNPSAINKNFIAQRFSTSIKRSLQTGSYCSAYIGNRQIRCYAVKLFIGHFNSPKHSR